MRLVVLAQWLHLIAAAAAVGGVLYVRLVLMKAVRGLPPEQGAMLLKGTARRFHPILWASIVVLLVTGVYNLGVAALSGLADPLYWRLLGLKVALALVLFVLAFAVTLPAPALAQFQTRRPQILLVNLLLAAVILYLSALLRRL